jgi:DNA-binding CsgD family transcriptional regulator
MVIKSYADLLGFATPEYDVPKRFFEKKEPNDSCIFLVSCFDNERIIFLEDTFEALTGYPSDNFINGGLRFWFPLVHPKDLPNLTERFFQAQQKVLAPGFNKEEIFPVVAEYRLKQPSGDWKKIRDSKYFLFPGNQAEVDKVLCKLELAGHDLDKHKTCNTMIEISEALLHEQSLLASKLTNREKEILLLIGDGLSTKMIAQKCNISINTVETHRRHLLEKLQVKNSMELVKVAAQLF